MASDLDPAEMPIPPEFLSGLNGPPGEGNNPTAPVPLTDVLKTLCNNNGFAEVLFNLLSPLISAEPGQTQIILTANDGSKVGIPLVWIPADPPPTP